MTSWVQRLKTLLAGASLRRKLIFTVALNCLAGIFIVSTFVFGYQAYSLRAQFRVEMAALARMVATYAVAPVSFTDQKAMEEVLGGLRARPEILDAVILNPKGELLARLFPADQDRHDLQNHSISGFEGWYYTVVQDISLKDESLGTLRMVATFRPVLFAAIRNMTLALLVASALSILGVILLTRVSARVLLAGLHRLAESAASIASTGDYSIRAPVAGGDEVGQLTSTFNRMLEQLQASDSALRSTNSSLAAEIAERKRLEKALVSSSRLAGMAEVATGVLHNVGNVLNSVNVSSHLLRDRLESSRVQMLERTVELFRPHLEQPEVFFVNDPRGRLVPKFIAELSGQLQEERRYLLHEIQSLTHNIEHIKEIVSTQQGYARTAGVIERLEAKELVDDAYRINQASLERHGITVERREPDRLQLSVDRHKALQVLVNLISNGIHALKSLPAGKRHLSLLCEKTSKTVRFTVEDRGVGIPAENLTAIFQHGFTTRPDGHGFGLHSGSLAAKSMGGTLTAHSDGLGKGARFTLEIPLNGSEKPVTASSPELAGVST